MSTAGTVLIGVVILIGLLGILLPAIPGALVVLAAVFIWSSEEATTASWAIFGVAAVCVAVTQVVKYTVPSRRMVHSGVPRSSMVVGALLGIVGFFAIPVVGLVLGFVLGVYVAERRRLRDRRAAAGSTRSAIRAVGLSMLIEFVGALTAAATWVFGVLFSP